MVKKEKAAAAAAGTKKKKKAAARPTPIKEARAKAEATAKANAKAKTSANGAKAKVAKKEANGTGGAKRKRKPSVMSEAKVRRAPQINIPARLFCMSWCADLELRLMKVEAKKPKGATAAGFRLAGTITPGRAKVPEVGERVEVMFTDKAYDGTVRSLTRHCPAAKADLMFRGGVCRCSRCGRSRRGRRRQGRKKAGWWRSGSSKCISTRTTRCVPRFGWCLHGHSM